MNTAMNPGETESALELNPWLSIWTEPGRTIRHIVNVNPEHHVLLLATLWGVNSALDRATSRGSDGDLGMLAIIGLCAVGGTIGGILSLYLAGFLVRWTGGWIGGRGDSRTLRTAIAWSTVPIAASLVLWLPQFLIEGRSMFTPGELEAVDFGGGYSWFLAADFVIRTALTVLSFILLIKGVAQVQGFSSWKALGNVLLAWGVCIVSILAIVLLLS